MQVLGDISMGVYMVHLLVYFYLAKFTTNGRTVPWQYPVGLAVSLVLGWVLTKFVDGPMRRCIRGKQQ